MEEGRRQEAALLHSPGRWQTDIHGSYRQHTVERGDEAEGFLIVTGAADKGLIDVHDRRPLVLTPEAAREWMRQDIGGKEAEAIAADGLVPTDAFVWHAVSRAVGNVKNQGKELLEPIQS